MNQSVDAQCRTLMRHVQRAQFVYGLKCLRVTLDIKADRIDDRVTPIHGEGYRSLVANVRVDRMDFAGLSRLLHVDIRLVGPSGRHTCSDAVGSKPLDKLTTKETRTAEYGHAA